MCGGVLESTTLLSVLVLAGRGTAAAELEPSGEAWPGPVCLNPGVSDGGDSECLQEGHGWRGRELETLSREATRPVLIRSEVRDLKQRGQLACLPHLTAGSSIGPCHSVSCN